MAWSESGVFAQTLLDLLQNVANNNASILTPTYKFALYTNDITPDSSVAANVTAPGTGVWATIDEVANTSGTGNWPAGGVTITTPAHRVDTTGTGFGSGVRYQFDADNITTTSVTTEDNAGSGAPAAAHGGLLYGDTWTTPVADQGLAFIYFGGAYQSTNGTFNVTWGTADSSTSACIWQLIGL